MVALFPLKSTRPIFFYHKTLHSLSNKLFRPYCRPVRFLTLSRREYERFLHHLPARLSCSMNFLQNPIPNQIDVINTFQLSHFFNCFHFLWFAKLAVDKWVFIVGQSRGDGLAARFQCAIATLPAKTAHL